MEVQKPNLFSFATSELSQDAFICWLASWADPKFSQLDVLLHKIAQEFVASLILKCKTEVPAIQTIDIQRQDDRIDVIVFVNKGEEDQLAILIEDKTHTDHHSGQLERYYSLLKGEKYGFKENQIVPIFLKTGYQSQFEIGEHYKTYLRKDFLEILRKGKESGIVNAIFCDFLLYLEGMESSVLQYSITDKWENLDWVGFFLALYENRDRLQKTDEANWNYIANPSGGFYGFWWHFLDVDSRCRVYIQLENERLCYKIQMKDEIADKRYYSTAREQVYMKLHEAASLTQLVVKRPVRMGNGKYMTVMKLRGDYRVFDEFRRFDMDKTIENLQAAERVITLAFGE